MSIPYNTGNPLGSTDPRDLIDNAHNFDEAMNSELPTFTDRLGTERDTWSGMEDQFDSAQSGRTAEFSAAQDQRETDFQNFLASSGFVSLGNYAPGLDFTAYNQYMAYGGFFYRPAPSSLPFTTSGTWVGADEDLFVLFSQDDLLRQELANEADPAKGAALIGFQGGTVRDKLLTLVTVADFGAVGDGVTDDTVALQAALDASVRVQFLAGASYLVSDKLDLSDNHVIQMVGATIEQLTDQTPIFDATNLENITIEGGRFLGKAEAMYVNTPSSQAIAIKAPGVNGLRVRNNRFENFYYSALMIGLAGNDIDFSHNVVVGPGAPVLGVDVNRRNTTGATILGTNVRIGGNDISATATGLIIAQGSQAVTITGNVIRDLINEHGIYADTGMKCLSIVGNTIRSTGAAGVGIKVQHYDSFGVVPENISIVGNSVSGCGSDGILVVNTDGVGAGLFATGVTISGNSVYSCGQHGIDVRNARGCTVSGNSIDQVAGDGVYVSRCDALNVNGNTVRETESHGIFDEGTSSDVSYLSNNLSLIGSNPVAHCGLLIQGVSEHTIANNVVRGTVARMAYGLFISVAPEGLATTDVRGNCLTGAAQVGARFPAGAGQLRYIGQNKFSGAAGDNLGQSIPETLQLGAEEDTHYGTSFPVSGTWRQGAKVYARAPAAGAHIGWVCVVGGTPGSWKTFGPVTI